jgi:DNA repair exonuclease SbcCD ATPase subunit
MILFTKLRYKNILSTGNTFTEIELTKSKTTLISGTNGAGKSTFLDALTFVLYNKPFRKINKPQLVNTINARELLVEVEFFIGSHEYMIRRGIKPTIFEIYKNGQLVNQEAANRDYQQYLEENILKINFKAFTQIVILGSATYVPFMELPAHARREVIEDLLDIQVFSTMNTLLKDRISVNKEEISSKKYDIDLLKTKIESAEKHNEAVRRMKMIEVDRIKERVGNLLSDIESDTRAIEEVQREIEDLLSKVTDKSKVQERHSRMLTIKAELSARKKIIDKTLSFYHDNDTCPTCTQGIVHKHDIIADHNKSLSEVIDGLNSLEVKMKETNERAAEIAAVESELQKKNNTIGEYRASIKLKKSQLKQIKTDLENAEKEVEEVDTSEIVSYNKKLKKHETEYESLVQNREVFAQAALMLKDGGIKTRIIRQYVPVMNKLINKYLGAFDLFVDFQLDENFNEVIKSRFRDTFSYASFSEGEKLRINLAILLTWRAVSKLRNSISTNLLIMDEVLDGAADSQGVDSLIEILNSLATNDNVFVISHRGDQFGDKFESHIRFEKVKNFSQISL